MSKKPKPVVETEDQKGVQTRSAAGKALAVFIALMIIITWANTMLEEMTIATVSTTTTQRGSLEKTITASGTLSAEVSVPILETESARVLSVYAPAGVRVEEGDALFALDYTDIVKTKQETLTKAEQDVEKKQRTLDWAAVDLSAAVVTRLEERFSLLESLESEYLAAQEAYQSALARSTDAQSAEVVSAKQTLERVQYQYEAEKRRVDGDTSVRDYIGKKDDLVAAEETLADAESDLLELLAVVESHEDRSYTRTVFSPVEGYVISSTLSVGSVLSTNSPVMMISDQSMGLKLRVTVDEESASELALGDAASITVGTDVYQCDILSIALSSDKEGMFDVDFLLPGDAGSVGISASMRVRKRTESYDIIIPLTALRQDDDGDFVYVVEQQESSLGARMSVRRVDVYVVDSDSSRAALQSGVSQRDTIVTRGDREISDGDRVRIAEE